MMGGRLEDTVTLELEDFVAAPQHLPTGPRDQRVLAVLHGGLPAVETLLDWWGWVGQLRLTGDGPAGPIVGQQAMVWHEALYRTLRIAQETTSCSNRRCVEPERIRQDRRAWQGAERESAELVAAACTAAALIPVWLDPTGPGAPEG